MAKSVPRPLESAPESLPESLPGSAPGAIKTILVYVGLDLVGDGVMKLPFLRALRQAFPKTRITWLAGTGKTAFAGELKALTGGLIDEVIEDAGIGSHLSGFFTRPLCGRRFDLVIDTQRRVPTTLIVRRIRHRVFVSGAAGWLLSDLKPPRPRAKPAAMIRQMLDLVAAARGTRDGGTRDGSARDGAADDQVEAAAGLNLDEEVTNAAAGMLPEGCVYLALAPGAGGTHKRWPLAHFIALANAQAEKGRLPVFLLGPGEADWRGGLAAAVPAALFPLQAEKNFDLAPEFTIAVARRCAAGVAADCGGGHLIAAADIPLISLFGPTDAEKFAPHTPNLTVIRAPNFGGPEMALIPVAAVERELDAVLAG